MPDIVNLVRFALVGAAIVGAFLWGLDYGITVGVEETTRFYTEMAPVCTPSTPLLESLPTG